MNIKKFIANSSREAMRLVRAHFGDDAVILANRSVRDGVEILALPGAAMNSLVSGAAQASTVRAPSADLEASSKQEPMLAPSSLPAKEAPARVSPEQLVAMQAQSRVERNVPARAETGAGARSELPRGQRTEAVQATRADAASLPNTRAESAAVRLEPTLGMMPEVMANEMKTMRNLLEVGLARLAWGDIERHEPDKAKLMRNLLAAGFSPLLSRYLMRSMPAQQSEAKLMTWAKSVLAHNLLHIEDDSGLVERGGVYALVGPTGVGKTTTTAKIAARCVVRHGAGKVALLTTDGFRIGAQEQLRIYAKLLSVGVHAVRDAAELQVTLDELRGKHVVLIDTVGMSQRDKQVAEQAAMLSGSKVRRLLLLNATSQGETLEDVVQAYRGDGLAGCIISKIDEAVSLGPVLDVAIRHKLVAHYMTNGQRVPEDMHLVNRDFLIDRAFRLARHASAYSLQDGEFGLAMLGLGKDVKELAPRSAHAAGLGYGRA